MKEESFEKVANMVGRSKTLARRFDEKYLSTNTSESSQRGGANFKILNSYMMKKFMFNELH